MANFANRLQERVAGLGQLCVGIDPSEETLADWGIPDTAEGARDFGYAIISACEGRVGIIKPQVAFFERFGSSGIFALEEVLAAARETDLLIISDAKRGDIGTTMLGYAQAWFGDDSPLRSDALTLSPYLGPTSLSETIEIARDVEAGVFLLAATSNPEAAELQKAKVAGLTVSAKVVRAAMEMSQGDVGVVIGPNQDLDELGLGFIRDSDIATPVLAPGFGAQGASLTSLREHFGKSAERVIASVSRGVYTAGARGIIQSIEDLKAQL